MPTCVVASTSVPPTAAVPDPTSAVRNSTYSAVMSRRRTLLDPVLALLALTLAAAGLSVGAAPAQAADLGRIAGTITGPGGAPLPGAVVSAYPTDCRGGCSSYAAMAGEDGGYLLDALPPGAYHLLVQKGPGYLPEYYPNALSEEGATEVVVAAGGTVAGIDARLELGGRLTGTVTGRDGRPLKGINVVTYAKERGTWRVYSETTTAADGSYVAQDVDGLLSGVYRLGFFDSSATGYLTQYYRGATKLRAAKSIVLEENQTVTGLDVRMVWPRSLKMVKAPRVIGQPRAGATLQLVPGTWKPAKVKVEILGWYADDLYHYLGVRSRKIRLVGDVLAKARGHFVKVRFTVSAPGYMPVTRLLTVPGGWVT